MRTPSCYRAYYIWCFSTCRIFIYLMLGCLVAYDACIFFKMYLLQFWSDVLDISPKHTLGKFLVKVWFSKMADWQQFNHMISEPYICNQRKCLQWCKQCHVIFVYISVVEWQIIDRGNYLQAISLQSFYQICMKSVFTVMQ